MIVKFEVFEMSKQQLFTIMDMKVKTIHFDVISKKNLPHSTMFTIL